METEGQAEASQSAETAPSPPASAHGSQGEGSASSAETTQKTSPVSPLLDLPAVRTTLKAPQRSISAKAQLSTEVYPELPTRAPPVASRVYGAHNTPFAQQAHLVPPESPNCVLPGTNGNHRTTDSSNGEAPPSTAAAAPPPLSGGGPPPSHPPPMHPAVATAAGGLVSHPSHPGLAYPPYVLYSMGSLGYPLPDPGSPHAPPSPLMGSPVGTPTAMMFPQTPFAGAHGSPFAHYHNNSGFAAAAAAHHHHHAAAAAAAHHAAAAAGGEHPQLATQNSGMYGYFHPIFNNFPAFTGLQSMASLPRAASVALARANSRTLPRAPSAAPKGVDNSSRNNANGTGGAAAAAGQEGGGGGGSAAAAAGYAADGSWLGMSEEDLQHAHSATAAAAAMFPAMPMGAWPSPSAHSFTPLFMQFVQDPNLLQQLAAAQQAASGANGGGSGGSPTYQQQQQAPGSPRGYLFAPRASYGTVMGAAAGSTPFSMAPGSPIPNLHAGLMSPPYHHHLAAAGGWPASSALGVGMVSAQPGMMLGNSAPAPAAYQAAAAAGGYDPQWECSSSSPALYSQLLALQAGGMMPAGSPLMMMMVPGMQQHHDVLDQAMHGNGSADMAAGMYSSSHPHQQHQHAPHHIQQQGHHHVQQSHHSNGGAHSPRLPAHQQQQHLRRAAGASSNHARSHSQHSYQSQHDSVSPEGSPGRHPQHQPFLSPERFHAVRPHHGGGGMMHHGPSRLSPPNGLTGAAGGYYSAAGAGLIPPAAAPMLGRPGALRTTTGGGGGGYSNSGTPTAAGPLGMMMMMPGAGGGSGIPPKPLRTPAAAAAAAATVHPRVPQAQQEPKVGADGLPRLNARQRRTLRRAKERAIKGLMEAGRLLLQRQGLLPPAPAGSSSGGSAPLTPISPAAAAAAGGGGSSTAPVTPRGGHHEPSSCSEGGGGGKSSSHTTAARTSLAGGCSTTGSGTPREGGAGAGAGDNSGSNAAARAVSDDPAMTSVYIQAAMQVAGGSHGPEAAANASKALSQVAADLGSVDLAELIASLAARCNTSGSSDDDGGSSGGLVLDEGLIRDLTIIQNLMGALRIPLAGNVNATSNSSPAAAAGDGISSNLGMAAVAAGAGGSGGSSLPSMQRGAPLAAAAAG